MGNPEYEDKFENYYEKEEEYSKREEKEDEFYRNILGLKESYADSLDTNYKEKEHKRLEERLAIRKRSFSEIFKKEFKETGIIGGTAFLGLLSLSHFISTSTKEDYTLSYSSVAILGFGLGLLTYSFYRCLKGFHRTMINK